MEFWQVAHYLSIFFSTIVVVIDNLKTSVDPMVAGTLWNTMEEWSLTIYHGLGSVRV